MATTLAPGEAEMAIRLEAAWLDGVRNAPAQRDAAAAGYLAEARLVLADRAALVERAEKAEAALADMRADFGGLESDAASVVVAHENDSDGTPRMVSRAIENLRDNGRPGSTGEPRRVGEGRGGGVMLFRVEGEVGYRFVVFVEAADHDEARNRVRETPDGDLFGSSVETAIRVEMVEPADDEDE